MVLPTQEPVVPIQDLVNDALSHRPELSESRINLSNTEISNKAIRSSLLPSLDLFAYYQGTGLGGALNPTYLCTTDPTQCTGQVNPATSYSGALGQLVDSTAPDKGVGLQLSIPIPTGQRNRFKCAVNWNTGNHSYAYSNWKTKFELKLRTHNLAYSKIEPA